MAKESVGERSDKQEDRHALAAQASFRHVRKIACRIRFRINDKWSLASLLVFLNGPTFAHAILTTADGS
ncbi:hypothetical protein CCGE525_37635 (plasmid) [Rhizobium jaguaris]|uniref:Uncharacterized protein n=1 Tax=Rhizobium jaguaris TaxID=1312183 RepID=A0A387G9F7_9HYPH|nr:hypothetical protein CCGE525_37635 [Rhizobium jaguaris]